MKNILSFFLISLSFASCMKGKHADLIIHNANIHTIDEKMSIHEAIAIKDGKILEIGPERQILNKYSSDEAINAQGKDIYPGFTDAHTHVFSLAEQKLSAYLFGLKSWDAVLVTLEKFQEKSKHKTIVGRGWDEANWNATELPTNETLNKLFPNQGVVIYRADGHTALVNDFVLKELGLDEKTKIDGGEISVKNGKCTGILIDKALEKVKPILPKYKTQELKKVLLDIQRELFMYGITNIHEAGIENHQIELLKKLIKSNELKLNFYAMLYPTEKNILFAKKHGHYTFKNLKIRSFKVLLDGALGSRGAWLKQSYSDLDNHFGLRTYSDEELKRIALICENTNYQLNGHAIGDAANLKFIEMCKAINAINKDHRWRIEHAQVIDPSDFKLLDNSGIYPSVQPTHAVSDQRWAEKRLGKKRIKGAYAYKTLLNRAGFIVFGTDFPVENMDPFATIFAATKRKNTANEPLEGFYPEEALDLESTLKAMTIWPAYASFAESTLGSLEKGKDATLVLFDKPIVLQDSYEPNFAYLTLIKGKKVYSID
jgi:predicted amidohydrolase YtcJ